MTKKCVTLPVHVHAMCSAERWFIVKGIFPYHHSIRVPKEYPFVQLLSVYKIVICRSHVQSMTAMTNTFKLSFFLHFLNKAGGCLPVRLVFGTVSLFWNPSFRITTQLTWLRLCFIKVFIEAEFITDLWQGPWSPSSQFRRSLSSEIHLIPKLQCREFIDYSMHFVIYTLWQKS